MRRAFGGPTKEQQKNETGRQWRMVCCDRLPEQTGRARPAEQVGNSPSAQEQNHDDQDQHYRSSDRRRQDNCGFVGLSCENNETDIKDPCFKSKTHETSSCVVLLPTFRWCLKLFLPAGHSGPPIAAEGLNLDQVGSVWSQIVDLNRVLLQFEHHIRSHIMFVVLRGKK